LESFYFRKITGITTKNMERELITEPKAEDPLLNTILNFGKDSADCQGL